MEEPPELKPMVASFLRGLPETSEDEGKKTASRAHDSWTSACGSHGRWRDVRPQNGGWNCQQCLGKMTHRKLAREVQGILRTLTWQLQELGSKEATLQAPPALPCLCRQKFMPPADLILACRDIREIPREKVVDICKGPPAFGAEQNNLPAGGEPRLLAKSILELREEVKWYLSFTDEEVFWGVALPKKEEEDSPTDPLHHKHIPGTLCT